MTDFLLVAWMSALIEFTRFQWILGSGESWTPGEKLKLLFAGYNGTRNTGSDVRVQEMLRQVRQVLGARNIDLSVTTFSFEFSEGYFGDARQLDLPKPFPGFLYRQARKTH